MALIPLNTFKTKTAILQSTWTTGTTATVYTAPIGTNGGFILKHSVGNLPSNSEVDTPLTYADYYYIEAMMRYKAMAK